MMHRLDGISCREKLDKLFSQERQWLKGNRMEVFKFVAGI